MARLLICLCKEDSNVINAAKKYYESEECYKYFGCRAAGIQGQLRMLKNLSDIVVTAHGSEDEIGEAFESFIDFDAKGFADILNSVKFSGKVYFHVCDGYKFGTNVNTYLTCNTTIYGAKGKVAMTINLSQCKPC
jgi:hypothetical protein